MAEETFWDMTIKTTTPEELDALATQPRVSEGWLRKARQLSEPLPQRSAEEREEARERLSPRALPEPPEPEVAWAPEDTRYDVLDHGFVRLVDHMGNDASIVRAARVSHGQGTKTPEQDAKLIAYLLKNKHTTPFEHVTLTFHVKCPLFVARQWMRHRTGSFNEISARYTEAVEEFYLPDKDNRRAQHPTNKQGSNGCVRDSFKVGWALKEAYDAAYATYKRLLEDDGLCREQARMVLPVATYTEFYWTVNLHNLFHFLTLRLDPHAQQEMREYAQVLLQIATQVAPEAVRAFTSVGEAKMRTMCYNHSTTQSNKDAGTNGQ